MRKLWSWGINYVYRKNKVSTNLLSKLLRRVKKVTKD